jgi:hypothetical protein
VEKLSKSGERFRQQAVRFSLGGMHLVAQPPIGCQCIPRGFCGNGSKGSLLPQMIKMRLGARRPARVRGISRWLA